MEQTKSSLNCAIVVPSCDSYEDSWQPFFSFFFKYWPDCPFPVYLVTGNKVYSDKRVRALALGEDQGWANNMKMVLDRIPEKYFLYFLEDVFLTKTVDTERVLSLLAVVKNDQVSCLRLYPSPGPDEPYPLNKELGVIGTQAPYRVSTMTAIWDKEAFVRLLRPGENAWQMELEGTKRSGLSKELFLSVWPKAPAIEYFATAIKRGKWQYDAILLCQREGISVDSTGRKLETRWQYWYRKLVRIPILGWFLRIPFRLRSFAVRSNMVSRIKRRLFLQSTIPYNVYLILKKWKQIVDFYKLRENFIENYDLIKRKDITQFTTNHWRDLNKRYEDYLRTKKLLLSFLRDRVIGYTMFVSGGGRAMKTELDFLEKNYTKNELGKYLSEEAIGMPILMNKKYVTSHNSIRHLYHLARFLSKTAADIGSLKTVVEWGGGYGNFAKIFCRVNKNTTYIIIDTPLFSCIQWLYLSVVLGRDKVNFLKREEGLIIRGMINIVPLGFVEKVNIKPDLFVSTWALSESSEFSQDYVLAKNFFESKHLLISYQKSTPVLPVADRINGIIRTQRLHIINEPIDHIPGSNYLFE